MSKGKAPLLEVDLSQMPDAPNRVPYHRRAQSEIIALPDDLSVDIGVQSSDENEDDLFSYYFDIDKLEQNEFFQPTTNNPAQALNSAKDPMVSTVTVAAHGPVGPATSGKSTGQASESEKSMTETYSIRMGSGVGPNNSGKSMLTGPRHRYSLSLDDTGSGYGTSVKEELSYPGSASASGSISGSALGLGTARLQEVGMSPDDAKKAMTNARLAELAISDPKKAKRIWANRQSAARSKERKVKYIAELENRLNLLRNESTNLTAQLNFLQKDTDGLTHENTELRSRLQNMERQNHMQDMKNDALRMDINQLKVATGHVGPNNGPAGMIPFGVPHNFAMNAQFFSGPRAINQPPAAGIHPSLMSAQQLQQLSQQPHAPPTPQVLMQQQQQVQAHALLQQQQAAQAQMRLPSPAQVMIRPPVMMPAQGQGMIRQHGHGLMPATAAAAGSHHAELPIKGPMVVVNKPDHQIEGNFENFN